MLRVRREGVGGPLSPDRPHVDGKRDVIRYGPKPPFEGAFRVPSESLLESTLSVRWEQAEPLWDGTPVWRLVVTSNHSAFTQLLEREYLKPAKIAWLKDTLS